MRVDIGRLTQEESIALFKQLIDEVLTESDLYEALNDCLTSDQKAELRESWTE